MWKYLIVVCIWSGFTLHWILGSIPNQRFFEVFAGLGIGLCLTMLDFGIFGWFAGGSDLEHCPDTADPGVGFSGTVNRRVFVFPVRLNKGGRLQQEQVRTDLRALHGGGTYVEPGQKNIQVTA